MDSESSVVNRALEVQDWKTYAHAQKNGDVVKFKKAKEVMNELNFSSPQYQSAE